VAEGTVSELRGKPRLLVRASPFEQARHVLERVEAGGVVVQDGSFILSVDPERAPWLNRELTAAGVAVEVMRPFERSLAQVFFELNGLTPEIGAAHG
jgi:ABC-2 type transport system ATP-binding protein